MNGQFSFCLGVFVATSIASTVLLAAETDSYINGDIPFLSIADVNREAEAWATCAAAYDISSTMMEKSKPAEAAHMHEMANGAEMAVLMSMVADEMKKDMTPEKFGAVWTYSKMASREIPKTRLNIIMADAERLGSAAKDEFIKKLANTIAICASNAESQQTYIDMWRNLAKSGILQLE